MLERLRTYLRDKRTWIVGGIAGLTGVLAWVDGASLLEAALSALGAGA